MGKGGTPALYSVISWLFHGNTTVFYATVEKKGLENVPPEGEPTILCFNHGNSLGDPIVCLGTTPRVVRCFAKDTLWKIPFIGTLVRMSAAIPVYRKKEHGENSAEFNKESFAAVYAALHNGDCIGLAPEGVSTFRSFAAKLKKGFAYIALEAVDEAVKTGRDDFNVTIVLQVICFTHREKFRSDVLLRYRPTVVVDKSWLEKDRKDAATEITNIVEKEMFNNIISAPDFTTIKMAMTAARIHRPFGTYFSLNSYMYLVQGWVEVMKTDPKTMLDETTSFADLRNKLESLQAYLDEVKVKDERIRRIEVEGCRPSYMKTTRIVLYRLFICAILTAMSAPGLVIWSPVWFFIRRKERDLLSRGAGWVDSFAETKMKYGFFYVFFIVLITQKYSPFVVAYLWMTMRLYEENMACARSIFGIIRLRMIPDATLQSILKVRTSAKEVVLKAVKLFPKYNAEGIKEDCGDNVQVDKTNVELDRPRWWYNFNPMRRQKKDWNELLRLSDHCTMNYVE